MLLLVKDVYLELIEYGLVLLNTPLKTNCISFDVILFIVLALLLIITIGSVSAFGKSKRNNGLKKVGRYLTTLFVIDRPYLIISFKLDFGKERRIRSILFVGLKNGCFIIDEMILVFKSFKKS